MTSEERRARTRERVKAWKAANGWSLKQQRKRRYARAKAKKQAGSRGVIIELVVREKREPVEVQETWYEHPALSEGDPETVREHAWEVARRKGVGVPVGLMEPEQKEVRRNDARRAGAIQRASGGAGGVVAVAAGIGRGTGDGAEEDDSGGGAGARTSTGETVAQWLARKTDPGVEVDLEL